MLKKFIDNHVFLLCPTLQNNQNHPKMLGTGWLTQNRQTHSNNSSATAGKLSVFDHFVGLALKGLSYITDAFPLKLTSHGILHCFWSADILNA